MVDSKEWKHKVVDAFDVSSSIKWKAQKSIAPDGTKFVGIRKFASKRDGTEVVTGTGISIPYTADGKHKKELEGIVKLLKSFL